MKINRHSNRVHSGALSQEINRNLVAISIFILFSQTADAQVITFYTPPAHWQSKGIGGGGALFSPAISPHPSRDIFIACDMGELFHKVSSDKTWTTIDHRQIQTGALPSPIQFTSDPSILYGLNYRESYDSYGRPSVSEDGGKTWNLLTVLQDPGPVDDFYYSVFAHPDRKDSLLTSNGERIYFSSNSGAEFTMVYRSGRGIPLHVAGVVFAGDELYLGTSDGLLVWEEKGEALQIAKDVEPFRTEDIYSFTGSVHADGVRLWCVTGDAGSIGIDDSPAQFYANESVGKVYQLDQPAENAWRCIGNEACVVPGFDAGTPHLIATTRTNHNVAYLGGMQRYTDDDTNPPIRREHPAVFKTIDGGATWSQLVKPLRNENISTGWQGNDGDRDWDYGEYTLGLAVSPNDYNHVIVTDLGFAHESIDGGNTWNQLYVNPMNQHLPGEKTPTKQHYEGIGLENTSCWDLTWVSPNSALAGFSDIRAIRTKDGGQTWSFDYTGLDAMTETSERTVNTIYQIVKAPDSNRLYAAVADTHDIYQSTTMKHSQLDRADGDIRFSHDGGSTWRKFRIRGNHQPQIFAGPVIRMTLDPDDSNTLYASVIDSEKGGIYVTHNLHEAPYSTFKRLSVPTGMVTIEKPEGLDDPDWERKRTRGHAFNIHALGDNRLIATYSGHRIDKDIRIEGDPAFVFYPYSGVFYSDDGGESWEDRSTDDMIYWTQDLVVDPHDTTGTTWYVGVFQGWQNANSAHGGLYRTKDSGRNWQRIFSPREALQNGFTENRVWSCTNHPQDENIAYVTTAGDGLWYTTNLQANHPDFTQVPDYPFDHPVRVFFNPHDQEEVWVTSFGNGLRVGRFGTFSLSPSDRGALISVYPPTTILSHSCDPLI